jgi:hypothetical protein
LNSKAADNDTQCRQGFFCGQVRATRLVPTPHALQIVGIGDGLEASRATQHPAQQAATRVDQRAIVTPPTASKLAFKLGSAPEPHADQHLTLCGGFTAIGQLVDQSSPDLGTHHFAAVYDAT